MSKLSGRLRTPRNVPVAVLCLALLALSGCSPAYQAPPVGQVIVQLNNTTPLSENGWSAIFQAAQKGALARMYFAKISVTASVGRHASSATATGTVNPPDRAAWSISVAGAGEQFYQQGQSAFKLVDGNWMQDAPLAELNLYPALATMVRTARLQDVLLYRQPQQYVIDEYCRVYVAQIPARLVPAAPILSAVSGFASPARVDLVTFFVGEKSGILRQVHVLSSGGVAGVGSMVVTTNTEFFDINSPVAKTTLPPTLFNQLTKR